MNHTRNLASVALIAIGLLIFQISVAAQSFSRTDYPLLGNNHIVADLNGDGVPDLAGVGLNSASVMLGNANGAFRARVQFPAGGPAQDLTSGDFNGDGRVDLAVSINDPECQPCTAHRQRRRHIQCTRNFSNQYGARGFTLDRGH